MDSKDYSRALRRGWWVMLIVAIIGASGAWGLTKLVSPAYTATSQVYVSLTQGTTANDLYNGSNYTRQQMASFVQLATTPAILAPVIDKLKLGTNPTLLAKSLAVTTPQDTSFLVIAATDGSAQRATQIANAVATQVGIVIQDTSPKTLSGKNTVIVLTVAPAAVPQAPSSPKTALNTIFGLAIGLLSAVLFLLLRTKFDTRIRRKEDLSRAIQAPNLGSIFRHEDQQPGNALVMLRSPVSAEAECYRQMRADLQFVAVDRKSGAFVVTSSLPGEGKSTIVCNLALALAEAGLAVLVIDADLRKPSIANYLGLEGAAGLTTVLAGRVQFGAVVQRWGESSLDILTSGVVPPNPSELLSSHAMASLLTQVAHSYEVVLIDTAPALNLADAAIISRLVDGVIVVADVTKARQPQVQQVAGSLRSAGAAVLGAVLNRTKSEKSAYGYYGAEKPSSLMGESVTTSNEVPLSGS